MSLIGTSTSLQYKTPYHLFTQRGLMFLVSIDAVLPISIAHKMILDRLVRDLNGEVNGSYSTLNIWNKFIAIYPMIGDTAGSHSLNLKNPGTFTLTYDATVTHSSSGIHSNLGRTHTGIIPSTHQSQDDKHMSVYNLEVTTGNTAYLSEAPGSGFHDVISGPDPGLSGKTGHSLSDAFIVDGEVMSSTKRFYLLTRRNATTKHYLNNANAVASFSFTSGGQPITEMIIGWGAVAPSTGGIYPFASFGSSLTDPEMLFLKTAVDAYLTGLGRLP